MPINWTDPNVFNPTEMGWAGARAGAESSLPSYSAEQGLNIPLGLPIGMLAGAGFGALAAGKKRRLAGALAGAVGGGALVAGGNAALGAYDARELSNKFTADVADAGLNQLGQMPGFADRWTSSKYLNDLYNTKAPQAPGYWGMSDGGRKRYDAAADSTRRLSAPEWLVGDQQAAYQAAQARRDYSMNQLREKGRLPFSQYVNPDPAEQRRLALDQWRANTPSLLKDWADTDLAAATNQRFR